MPNAESTLKPGLNDGASFTGERTDPPGHTAAPPNSRQKRLRRSKWFWFQVVVVALTTSFVGGTLLNFGQFAHQVATAKAPTDLTADGIVVLTGGQERVAQAVRLLEEGRAQRLLISGVHPGTTREQLAVVTASSMPLKQGSVDLDRAALNTAGNAAETATWAQENEFSSLLVVTSAYHLPRASVELSGALPDVQLIGYPVFSKELELDIWYRKPATIRLLFREYVKYILAHIRIAAQKIG